MHHSAATMQKSIVAAIQKTPGRRSCSTVDGGGASIARRRLVHHASTGTTGATSSAARQPTCRAAVSDSTPDQHDVGDAGGHVRLGERDRATCAVVVGERGLDRHEQQSAAEPHEQHRADGRRGDASHRQPDRPRAHQRGGRPEQCAPPDGAFEARGDHPRDQAPRRERRDVQAAGRVAQVELVTQVHDDEPGRCLQVGEPGQHQVRKPGQPVAPEPGVICVTIHSAARLHGREAGDPRARWPSWRAYRS